MSSSLEALTTRSTELIELEKALRDAIDHELTVGIEDPDHRVTTAPRAALDTYLLSLHFPTCPFAKQHKHDVGDVEQLPPASERYKKIEEEDAASVNS